MLLSRLKSTSIGRVIKLAHNQQLVIAALLFNACDVKILAVVNKAVFRGHGAAVCAAANLKNQLLRGCVLPACN